MADNIRVIQTWNTETPGDYNWFLEGDLSAVALDTETMGHNWLRIHREIQTASDERRKVLQKELDQYKKEALNPKTCYLAVLQVATRDNRCLIFVLNNSEVIEAARVLLKMLLKITKPVWVLQNAKFDFHQIMHHWGIAFDDQKIHDTQLCEILIKGSRDSESVSLEAITHRYPLPPDLVKTNTKERVSDWWEGLTEEQIKYASRDVLALIPLMEFQKDQMRRDQLLRVRKLECALTPHLVKLERTGIRFDKEKLFTFLLKAKEFLKDRQEVYDTVFAGIPPTAPKQILKRIEAHYGLKPQLNRYNGKLGRYEEIDSADKFALLDAGLLEGDPKTNPLQAYLDIKEVLKRVQMAKTWLELPDQKLFVNFYQLPVRGGEETDDGGARTGRMSSSPQIQNYANFMKQFVVAPDGCLLVSSDYAAIELRLLASYANDPTLKKAFAENRLLHAEMAINAFHIEDADPVKLKHTHPFEYRCGKEINFGFGFGMGGQKFCARVLRATQGGINLTEEQGWAFRNAYFDRYPMVRYYHQHQLAFGALNGYVETRDGRRRYYNEALRPITEQPFLPFWDPLRGEWVGHELGRQPIYYKGKVTKEVNVTRLDSVAAWRAADWKWKNVCYNHPIQGSAAGGMKQAIILVQERFQSTPFGIFATVHDSLDGFCPENQIQDYLQIVNAAMSFYLPDVAIEVEHTVGRCWAHASQNLTSDDHGLWVFSDNPNEFQSDVALQELVSMVG